MIPGRLLSIIVATAFVWFAGITVGTAQTMRVHFIDVGQGDATLIEFPCAAVLVDTGGESNAQFNSDEALLHYLSEFFSRRADLNKTLHSLIITHPHVDHTRGVQDVLTHYRVLNAVTNGQVSGSGRYGQIAMHNAVANSEATPTEQDDIGFTAVWQRDLEDDKGLTSASIDPVNCADDGDPRITVLWGRVGGDLEWNSHAMEDENNHSVIVRFDFGESSLLLTGDLEADAIPDLLIHFRDSDLLDVDVYQVGHHGSANGTTNRLLGEMTPEISVISMGPADRETNWTAWAYGHPRRTIVEMLQRHTTGQRAEVSRLVANGPEEFAPMAISRAIYATGWEGTVILEGDTTGQWTVVRPIGGATGSQNGSTGLNVNTATIEQLVALPMIGQVRASAIVSYRSEHGPFESLESLDQVPGIGPATLNAIQHLVSF